ncbi:MAG: branched-chain amino acid ABC transporter substrate-binding protein [Roseibium sp.]|uniref:branched-chain amino acid ABC transporter substrate-binding protein n=1 Tax=Roseibium sp. TaxID=1936156 RepID=UPI001B26DEA5|nr:branched-chain amino acid ABC transporter substrate-binding protein [Roseibium sp.]MBO6893655.1 branched-chain amino acid ABC transporter substrate-binding protein [Roseibium sp.]MBO6928150.1 branched-chain amino acid ABC transporter substrate-binding protein [Roseibium sp.]
MTTSRLAICVSVLAFCLLPKGAFAEIPIAVAGPMKGQFGQIGEQMQAGAELAVADINANGGVNGELLRLEVADDACNADKAVAVANQLIGKGVVFVAGHFCFSASIPASEVYQEAGIIQISPGTTLPKYTDERPGEGIFRLAPRDDRQGQVAGRFLAEEFGTKQIAILHDKTAYGKGLTDAVKSVMNDLGTIESIALGFDAGENDYRALVSQLKLEGIDVVYLGGYHPEAGLIKLEMERQGLDALLVSGDALMTEEYLAVAGPIGNGTILSYPEVPRDLQTSQAVISVLEERGLPADRYALATYAAIQAWAQAARAAGDFSSETVAGSLANGSFETILGTVEFNENGDSNRPDYVWYEWRNGDPVRR